MTRESVTEESFISASLSSIIRISLSKLASTVKLYDESRSALKRVIRGLERENYREKIQLMLVKSSCESGVLPFLVMSF
jgi:hypothetical protein